MKQLCIMTWRNIKLFFKQKQTLLSAMVAPLVILFLYTTFLRSVMVNVFQDMVPETFRTQKLVNGFVGGWILSSLMATITITIAFTANMIIVQDKAEGQINDIRVTSLNQGLLAISYYLATVVVGLIICYIALFIGLIYLAFVGFYLSITDILLILFDTFLLVLFGTAVSSIICRFLSSVGAIAAVNTIVGASYGFLAGAYMPISQFGEAFRNIILFMPGTYGTCLLRNHFMNGALDALSTVKNVPHSLIVALRDNFDCNMYLFKHKIEIWQMYVILACSVLVLVGIYIILYYVRKKKHFAHSKANIK